ncbi:MAG: hypothetical protein M4579_001558 [Chaenotheca gracillima]|nr:MAG: hypothetical protein M4579_001558 [Chaenotheca gracillima]
MSSEQAAEAPTLSHELAVSDHEEKGAAQQGHDAAEVKDLGWHDDPEHVPAPVVGGLPNEELWVLIRRFDKAIRMESLANGRDAQQMYHVKAIKEAPMGGLDLNIADEEEFSPDKLRANLERLYMTVIIGLAGFAKHIARLRSWKETRRTAAFCTAYFIAWALDLVVPTILTLLITLIAYPPSRDYLFPPAPLALVSSNTGEMKKPAAGMLGTHDSLTGAPEKHQGEAVEQEASNFVNSLASIGISSAVGKHPQGEIEEDTDAVGKNMPDPTAIATRASDAQDAAAGATPNVKHDKTKQPVEEAMWGKTRPVMHILANIADAWERFANALSPTAPFPREPTRLKLGAIVLPLLVVSLLLTSYWFVKMVSFISGGAFFGQPLMDRGLELLNKYVPDWPRFLLIQNTILKGVPTNAQLAITLLRIGEANRAPLPPPPHSDKPPSEKPPALHGDDVPMDVSHEEVQEAIHMDPSATDATATSTATKDEPQPKHRHGHKLMAILKGSAHGSVSTALHADRVKASAGSTHAKNRIGVIPKPDEKIPTGPIEFKARYRGKKGLLFIHSNAEVPSIHFTLEKNASEKLESSTVASPSPVWTVPIKDIKELKKVGGLGWKAKIVVGWAMSREVADGIQIVDRKGEEHTFTAITLREELFNRLVAMGGQKWESW